MALGLAAPGERNARTAGSSTQPTDAPSLAVAQPTGRAAIAVAPVGRSRDEGASEGSDEAATRHSRV